MLIGNEEFNCGDRVYFRHQDNVYEGTIAEIRLMGQQNEDSLAMLQMSPNGNRAVVRLVHATHDCSQCHQCT